MALTKLNTHGIGVDVILAEDIAANAVTVSEIQDNAVTLAKLSATGTASNTTFLRGDYTWVADPHSYNDWAIKTTTPYLAVVKDQLIINSASAFIVNLPAASESGNNEGDTVIICNAGAGEVTVTPNGSNKINSSSASGTLPQGNSAQLVFVSDTIGWFEV